jgi:hypothetical protein
MQKRNALKIIFFILKNIFSTKTAEHIIIWLVYTQARGQHGDTDGCF